MERFLPFIAGGLFLGLAFGVCAQAASTVQAVSVADPLLGGGALGDGDSTVAALSADGRLVAFVSSANNLVTNDHNGLNLDVLVRDRQTGVTRLVSASADGNSSGDGNSFGPSFSADGRLVVFESQARNLVTNAIVGAGDIFVRDLVNGVTALVSMSPDGSAGGNGASTAASITPDGRFVVFESDASNLALNDNNNVTDVFWRDLQAGTTTLVSVNWQGTASASNTLAPGLPGSIAPAISADGRYVAFLSLAGNVVRNYPISSSTYYQVYVRDVTQQTNFLVSVAPDGSTPANGGSANAMLSADGRYVVFESYAGNLTTNTLTTAVSRIYRRDLQTGTTVLVSQRLPYSPGAAQAAMSADGRFVAFAENRQAVGAAINRVYVWDAATGTNTLVSLDANGAAASSVADSPVISDDGKVIAFVSSATNLATVQTGGIFQAYVRDLVAGVTRLASTSADGLAGSSSDCLFPILSADGAVAAFETFDGNLVADDNNLALDVFAYPPPLRLQLLSFPPGGRPSLAWEAADATNPRVQFKNSLDESEWHELPGTPVQTRPNLWSLEDVSTDLGAQRFYRLLLVP